MTILEKLEKHLRQLPPHVASRESGLLLAAAAEEIRRLSVPAGWARMGTAPRDGTPFVWMGYTTVLHTDKPHEYRPYSEVLRRCWIGEEKGIRDGDGFWMGEYGSKGDDQVAHGYWCPLAPKPRRWISITQCAPTERDLRRGPAGDMSVWLWDPKFAAYGAQRGGLDMLDGVTHWQPLDELHEPPPPPPHG